MTRRPAHPRSPIAALARRLVVAATTVAAAAVAGPRAAAAQASPAVPTTNPWSLGIDAALSSRRNFVDGVHGQAVTHLLVPDPQLRLDYRASSRLQLEFPLALDAYRTSQENGQTVTAGVNANVYLVAEDGAVRPFAGAGGYLSVDRLHVLETFDRPGVSRTDTRSGVSARLGLDWQALPSLSVRPALFYQHQFEGNAVGFDAFGATLGSAIHFGPQAPVTGPSPIQLSFGAEAGNEVRAAFRESPAFATPKQTVTRVQVPRAVVGLFVPVRQLAIGANVQAERVSAPGISGTSVLLQPRVELNLNPRFHTERGIRLGAQGNYLIERGTDGSYSSRSTRSGAGGDVSLTFPVNRSLLYRVGVGYDYLGGNPGRYQPNEQRVSLKVGLDAL